MITSYKIYENVQQSKKILNSLDIPLDDINYLKLVELLKNNPGYLGKFTKWLFQDEVGYDQLVSLYDSLNSIKIDINRFNDPVELSEYITEFNINKHVDQVIKQIPSQARKSVTPKLRELISNNIKYAKTIARFYTKKAGWYKDKSKELYETTNSLINNLMIGWGVDKIRYNNDEVVYKDEFTLILHISSFDRSVELGSIDWCIVTREEDWDKYTSNFQKQYFIYDFTKPMLDNDALIGVTIGVNDSISDAHWRNDDEIKNYSVLNVYRKYLTPYDKEYLKSKIDINDFKEVIKYGLTDEMKRLIDQGQDPSAYNNYAIRTASQKGHLVIVKLLLLLRDSGVDPSVNNNYAIRYASRDGHIEVVKMLLRDSRVDPGDDNNYAIQIASQKGHLVIVKLLLRDSRVDPSVNNNYAIQIAPQKGHLDIVKLLLQDPRVNPSVVVNYAIRYASLNGYTEIVKLLLRDERVDPSDDNNSAIRFASLNGHLEVVRILLLSDSRVDPSDDNNSAIRVASEYGHVEVVKLLLSDSRVDPSDDNNYAIRYASRNGHIEVIKLLLQDPRVIDNLTDEHLIKYNRYR